MNLIGQILRDLRKEVGWVLFYGILTSAVVMAFLLIGQSYSHVAQQNEAITRFVDQEITITRLQDTHYGLPPVPAQAPDSVLEADSLSDYYEEVFSPAGNAGTYVMMPGRLGYTQVIVLLGVYADLTPYGVTPAEGVTFAVSGDLSGQAEDTISVGGMDYPLHQVPADMDLYHPLLHITAESGFLNDTLFVFSKDYGLIRALFPPSEFWEMRESDLLGRFILRSPGEGDLIRLRSVVSKNTGQFVNLQTTKAYINSTTISGVRTHQTYLLFYLTAIVVLFGAMLTNLYRILSRKIPDYATHHLFGASKGFILARMVGFGLSYHAIPVVWAVYIMSVNRMATKTNIGLLMTAVVVAVMLIVLAAYRRLLARFRQGLRRE